MAEVLLRIPSSYLLLYPVSELSRKILLLYYFPEKDATLFSLAVEEVLSNIIKHSYKGKENGWIEIGWKVSRSKAQVEFKFGGTSIEIPNEEFDLKEYIRERRKDGLGLEIIKRATDEVNYGREREVNWWRIIKRLKD